MRFDVGTVARQMEKLSPQAALKLSAKMLGLVSPWNSHLKSKLTKWTDDECEIRVQCHRGVKNHVGSIHAGALFTAGESCAGLIIVRNFNFNDYRPLMTDVSVTYHKQAKATVTVHCQISNDELERVRRALETEDSVLLPMETHIKNLEGDDIATVDTTWQIKPWKKVRA